MQDAEFIHKFVQEHNTLPTEQIVNANSKVKLEVPKGLNEQHYDWLLGEFETFSRHKSLERAIRKC